MYVVEWVSDFSAGVEKTHSIEEAVNMYRHYLMQPDVIRVTTEKV